MGNVEVGDVLLVFTQYYNNVLYYFYKIVDNVAPMLQFVLFCSENVSFHVAFVCFRFESMDIRQEAITL